MAVFSLGYPCISGSGINLNICPLIIRCIESVINRLRNFHISVNFHFLLLKITFLINMFKINVFTPSLRIWLRNKLQARIIYPTITKLTFLICYLILINSLCFIIPFFLCCLFTFLIHRLFIGYFHIFLEALFPYDE